MEAVEFLSVARSGLIAVVVMVVIVIIITVILLIKDTKKILIAIPLQIMPTFVCLQAKLTTNATLVSPVL
jgi:hypothetical protein